MGTLPQRAPLTPLDRRAHLDFAPLTEALTRRRFLTQVALASLLPLTAQAADAVPIRPYLQSITPDSIWVTWLTEEGTDSEVLFGESANALSASVVGECQTLGPNYQLHSVHLTGLRPGTFYFYKVRTGAQQSEVFRFRTLPPRGTKSGRLRFLVVGDNQILNEPRYETLLARAKATIEARYDAPIEQAIDVFLNVGDQVDVGTLQHYRHVHLAKEAELSANLAVMTLVGNHETYSDPSLALYKAHFNYDHLTYAGITSPGGDTYYANHVANILFLHLNSEDASAAQTAWIIQILQAAKNDPQLEWIVSLVHRPYQAEQYVGDISSWYRNEIAPLLAQTPKHVLAIGAHHHLYARGQMRDWPVYHIISGGTAWDQFWGQSTERNFDDVQKTIANWAWQILEFDLDARKLTVECFAEAHPKLGFVYPSKPIDSFHRQFGLAAPEYPVFLNESGRSLTLPLVLRSSPFRTDSGESLNSTHFQIATDAGFTNLKEDLIRDRENFFGDTGAPNYTPVDTHVGVDLLAYTVADDGLPNGTYYARVRHRDTNCLWSAWSPALIFTIEGSVEGAPKLTLTKRVYSEGEDISIAYENGPGLATDWIGIYRKGQKPQEAKATVWTYVAGPSGTHVFTTDLAAGVEWFAAFFTADGYTEIAPRVPFYIGSTPTLSVGKAAYDEGEAVAITYANAPAGKTDWIGVYRIGEMPGEVGSTKWAYVAGASGTLTFSGLTKGFYYAVYFVNDAYYEISQRIPFSVGSQIAQVTLAGGVEIPYGQDFTITFSNGAGTPKDYIGIFTRGATPGVDRLVTYLYVGGKTGGNVTFTERLPAGEYFLALFINDSYTDISNRLEFTVVGGPTMPQVDDVRRAGDKQMIISVRVQPGVVYRLEKTTDLQSWSSVQTFTGEGLRMEFTVAADSATEAKAFYRIVKMP